MEATCTAFNCHFEGLATSSIDCAELLGESNHGIFKSINTKKPSEELVVNLTDQLDEVKFFQWVHALSKRDVRRIEYHIVICDDSDLHSVQVDFKLSTPGDRNCLDDLAFLTGDANDGAVF
ncbi:hypothetical protein H257_14817 [Aphanomyces astaci]|uniref:Uncharacterized protein n=1 Tax=Aphanomyces astaci TaxID=112090 RepID=W4FPM3_APHAT|nr:hypothetical protein H257_14817 [Aphanomyces astaci]ETV69442.1 hypothetical protein H257_14817 [Aphanomyces astaci]|eukprot:XP_009841015.1 hypothetical protein H257_14817 [Aphanomyces astaci]